MWSSRKVSSDRFSPSTDELEILSLPESSLHEALASPSEQSTSAISIVNGNLDDESSNRVPDHDYSSSSIRHIDCVQEISASKRPKHRTQFLPGWEKRPEAQYKTYVFDGFGARHEQLSCWLSVSSDGNSMRCKLCTKRAKGTNANGKMNY